MRSPSPGSSTGSRPCTTATPPARNGGPPPTAAPPHEGAPTTPPAGGAGRPAGAMIDASLYLVLATADGTGRPWSSPVYFAHDGYAEFLWVSAPEAEHSRNIAARPQVGIVI